MKVAARDLERMARPTGVAHVAAYEIPILGQDEWLAAARRLASASRRRRLELDGP